MDKNKKFQYFYADSSETNMIYKCINYSKKIKGYICLMGVSNGNIINNIIISLAKLRIKNKIILGIDPYGSLEHYKKEDLIEHNQKFSNNTRNYMLNGFINQIKKYDLHGLYIQLDNKEFIKRYSDGVPFYYRRKEIIDKYSTVILSANNCINERIIEFEFFRERMNKDATIIFTDINKYPHMDKIHSYILSNNFEVFISAPTFISYKKIM